MTFEIPFEISKSHHIFIPVYIKKNCLNALIDTGATYNCIDIETAKQMDLNLIHNGEEARGINEIPMIRFDVNIAEIAFNEAFSVFEEDCAAIDFSHINTALMQSCVKPIQFIIGGNFCSKYKAVIDYNQKLLRLDI